MSVLKHTTMPSEYLKDIWHADTATAYRILQHLEVRTIDEKGLEDQVRESVHVRFLTNPDNVCETLRRIVQDSVHKTIDQKYLISVLQDRGFTLRKLMVPNNTLPLVDDVTDGYLENCTPQAYSRLSHFSRLDTGATCQDQREVDWLRLRSYWQGRGRKDGLRNGGCRSPP